MMKRALIFAMLALPSLAVASITDDVRNAALDEKCLESVVGQLIEEYGQDKAANVVAAAFMILGEPGVAKQQKELGCTGAIAQAAILAGLDPTVVLEATAAGEGGSPLSAPAGLGGPGIIGGVKASPDGEQEYVALQ